MPEKNKLSLPESIDYLETLGFYYVRSRNYSITFLHPYYKAFFELILIDKETLEDKFEFDKKELTEWSYKKTEDHQRYQTISNNQLC